MQCKTKRQNHRNHIYFILDTAKYKDDSTDSENPLVILTSQKKCLNYKLLQVWIIEAHKSTFKS